MHFVHFSAQSVKNIEISCSALFFSSTTQNAQQIPFTFAASKKGPYWFLKNETIMKKNILKSLTGITAMALVMGLCACNDELDSDDSTPITNNTSNADGTIGADPIASPLDEATVTATTSFMGNIPSEASELLNKRFVNHASGFGADVIILSSDQLYSHQKELKQAYDEGKIIVEVDAKGQLHKDFWNSIGVTTILDADSTATFVGMKKGACFMTDNLSKIKNDNLNILVKWINEHLVSNKVSQQSESVSSTSNSGTRALGSTYLAENKACETNIDLEKAEMTQEYTYDNTIRIENFQLCKVLWSDPDCVSRTGHMESKVLVTPIHIYNIDRNKSGQNMTGDYYFVQVDVCSHNHDIYGVYSKWHGAVKTYAHAFFSRRINFSAQLVDAQHNAVSDLSFYQTPAPESSQGASSYSHGFSFTLNVTGQGGYTKVPRWNVGGTVGGSWSWSNSTSHTITDQNIEMYTDASTKKVGYHFCCDTYDEDDDTSKAIPAIARNDQHCQASWCWHVANVPDDSEVQHSIHFSYYPTYAWIWRHSTWGGEGYYADRDFDGKDVYIELNKPNRASCGIFNFTSACSASKNVTQLKVVKEGESGIYFNDAKTLKSGATVTYTVPVGTYTVYYQIVDCDDIESQGKWYSTDTFTVTTGDVTERDTAHGKASTDPEATSVQIVQSK